MQPAISHTTLPRGNVPANRTTTHEGVVPGALQPADAAPEPIGHHYAKMNPRPAETGLFGMPGSLPNELLQMVFDHLTLEEITGLTGLDHQHRAAAVDMALRDRKILHDLLTARHPITPARLDDTLRAAENMAPRVRLAVLMALASAVGRSGEPELHKTFSKAIEKLRSSDMRLRIQRQLDAERPGVSWTGRLQAMAELRQSTAPLLPPGFMAALLAGKLATGIFSILPAHPPNRVLTAAAQQALTGPGSEHVLSMFGPRAPGAVLTKRNGAVRQMQLDLFHGMLQDALALRNRATRCRTLVALLAGSIHTLNPFDLRDAYPFIVEALQGIVDNDRRDKVAAPDTRELLCRCVRAAREGLARHPSNDRYLFEVMLDRWIRTKPSGLYTPVLEGGQNAYVQEVLADLPEP